MPFPFVEDNRVRARPALVVSQPVGPSKRLIWTVMITGARRGAWPGDIAIGADHARFGLPVPCYIRTAKIAALEIDAIDDRLGRLTAALMQQVQGELRAALGWR